MAEPDYKNNLDDFKANCQAIVKMITNDTQLVTSAVETAQSWQAELPMLKPEFKQYWTQQTMVDFANGMMQRDVDEEAANAGTTLLCDFASVLPEAIANDDLKTLRLGPTLFQARSKFYLSWGHDWTSGPERAAEGAKPELPELRAFVGVLEPGSRLDVALKDGSWFGGEFCGMHETKTGYMIIRLRSGNVSTLPWGDVYYAPLGRGPRRLADIRSVRRRHNSGFAVSTTEELLAGPDWRSRCRVGDLVDAMTMSRRWRLAVIADTRRVPVASAFASAHVDGTLVGVDAATAAGTEEEAEAARLALGMPSVLAAAVVRPGKAPAADGGDVGGATEQEGHASAADASARGAAAAAPPALPSVAAFAIAAARAHKHADPLAEVEELRVCFLGTGEAEDMWLPRNSPFFCRPRLLSGGAVVSADDHPGILRDEAIRPITRRVVHVTVPGDGSLPRSMDAEALELDRLRQTLEREEARVEASVLARLATERAEQAGLGSADSMELPDRRTDDAADDAVMAAMNQDETVHAARKALSDASSVWFNRRAFQHLSQNIFRVVNKFCRTHGGLQVVSNRLGRAAAAARWTIAQRDAAAAALSKPAAADSSTESVWEAATGAAAAVAADQSAGPASTVAAAAAAAAAQNVAKPEEAAAGELGAKPDAHDFMDQDVLATLVRMLNHMSPMLSDAVCHMLFPGIITSIITIIRGWGDDRIKHISSAAFVAFLGPLTELCRRVQSRREALATRESLMLLMARRFSKSNFQRRMEGVKLLSDLADMVSNRILHPLGLAPYDVTNDATDSTLDKATAMDGVAMDELGFSWLRLDGNWTANRCFRRVPVAVSLTAAKLLAAIEEDGLLAHILVDSPHEQLTARAGDLLRLLSRNGSLPLETLEAAWDRAARASGSGWTSLMQLFNEVSSDVHWLHNALFLRKARELGATAIDESLVTLLFGIATAPLVVLPGGESEADGLGVLDAAASDGAAVELDAGEMASAAARLALAMLHSLAQDSLDPRLWPAAASAESSGRQPPAAPSTAAPRGATPASGTDGATEGAAAAAPAGAVAGARAPIAVARAAAMRFDAAIALPKLADLRPALLDRCIADVKDGRSVTRALQVLRHVVRSFDGGAGEPADEAAPSAPATSQRAQVIQDLEHRHSVISVLLGDLARLRADALATAAASGVAVLCPAANADIESWQDDVHAEDSTAVSREEEYEEIKDPVNGMRVIAGAGSGARGATSAVGFLSAFRSHLECLHVLLGESSLLLSVEQAVGLWQVGVVGALSLAQRDEGLLWFRSSILELFKMHEGDSEACVVFTGDVVSRLFGDELVRPWFAPAASAEAFGLVNMAFLYVNSREDKLVATVSSITVHSLDLQGVDVIWGIALRSGSDLCAKQAIGALMRLVQSLAPELRADGPKLAQSYVHRCIRYIRSVLPAGVDLGGELAEEVASLSAPGTPSRGDTSAGLAAAASVSPSRVAFAASSSPGAGEAAGNPVVAVSYVVDESTGRTEAQVRAELNRTERLLMRCLGVLNDLVVTTVGNTCGLLPRLAKGRGRMCRFKLVGEVTLPDGRVTFKDCTATGFAQETAEEFVNSIALCIGACPRDLCVRLVDSLSSSMLLHSSDVAGRTLTELGLAGGGIAFVHDYATARSKQLCPVRTSSELGAPNLAQMGASLDESPAAVLASTPSYIGTLLGILDASAVQPGNIAPLLPVPLRVTIAARQLVERLPPALDTEARIRQLRADVDVGTHAFSRRLVTVSEGVERAVHEAIEAAFSAAEPDDVLVQPWTEADSCHANLACIGVGSSGGVPASEEMASLGASLEEAMAAQADGDDEVKDAAPAAVAALTRLLDRWDEDAETRTITQDAVVAAGDVGAEVWEALFDASRPARLLYATIIASRMLERLEQGVSLDVCRASRRVAGPSASNATLLLDDAQRRASPAPLIAAAEARVRRAWVRRFVCCGGVAHMISVVSRLARRLPAVERCRAAVRDAGKGAVVSVLGVDSRPLPLLNAASPMAECGYADPVTLAAYDRCACLVLSFAAAAAIATLDTSAAAKLREMAVYRDLQLGAGTNNVAALPDDRATAKAEEAAVALSTCTEEEVRSRREQADAGNAFAVGLRLAVLTSFRFLARPGWPEITPSAAQLCSARPVVDPAILAVLLGRRTCADLAESPGGRGYLALAAYNNSQVAAEPSASGATWRDLLAPGARVFWMLAASRSGPSSNCLRVIALRVPWAAACVATASLLDLKAGSAAFSATSTAVQEAAAAASASTVAAATSGVAAGSVIEAAKAALLRGSHASVTAAARKSIGSALLAVAKHTPPLSESPQLHPAVAVAKTMLQARPTFASDSAAASASATFFDTAVDVVRAACGLPGMRPSVVDEAFAAARASLVEQIMASPTRESRESRKVDRPLEGALRLLRELLAWGSLSASTELAEPVESGGRGLLDYVLHQGLMEVPSVEILSAAASAGHLGDAEPSSCDQPSATAVLSSADSAEVSTVVGAPPPAAPSGTASSAGKTGTEPSRGSGWLDPPLCKTGATRSAACKLLSQLVKHNAAAAQRAVAMLGTELEIAETDGSLAVSTFRFTPLSDSKSSTGYVGLVNPCCVCYMNSLNQQLFMMEGLRYGLLGAESGAAAETDEEKRDNLLWQLQAMFSHLEASERRAFHPRPWCHAFKDPAGRPTSMLVQMDAQEYLTALVTRLEERLKGTRSEGLIAASMGGRDVSMLTRVDGKGEPRRLTPTKFVTIPCNLQGCDSLHTALEQYTTPDRISDYNWAESSDSDERDVTDVLKRACLERLSNTVVFQLNRFALNYDTFERYKVNDRFEFPPEIDLYPFTAEGIAWKEELAARRSASQVPGTHASSAMDATGVGAADGEDDGGGDGEAAGEAGAGEAAGADPDGDGEAVAAGGAGEGRAEAQDEQEDPGGAEAAAVPDFEDESSRPYTPERPAGYYKFVLVGVVVHMGSAESGHYFSLIRERGNRARIKAGARVSKVRYDAAASARENTRAYRLIRQLARAGEEEDDDEEEDDEDNDEAAGEGEGEEEVEEEAASAATAAAATGTAAVSGEEPSGGVPAGAAAGAGSAGKAASKLWIGQWFEFNDALVQPFDPARMEEMAFGSDEATEDTLFGASSNAYMLVYERVQALPVEAEVNVEDSETWNAEPLSADEAGEALQQSTAAAEATATAAAADTVGKGKGADVGDGEDAVADLPTILSEHDVPVDGALVSMPGGASMPRLCRWKRTVTFKEVTRSFQPHHFARRDVFTGQAPLPAELEQAVMADNRTHVRQRHLFDPALVGFVSTICDELVSQAYACIAAGIAPGWPGLPSRLRRAQRALTASMGGGSPSAAGAAAASATSAGSAGAAPSLESLPLQDVSDIQNILSLASVVADRSVLAFPPMCSKDEVKALGSQLPEDATDEDRLAAITATNGVRQRRRLATTFALLRFIRGVWSRARHHRGVKSALSSLAYLASLDPPIACLVLEELVPPFHRQPEIPAVLLGNCRLAVAAGKIRGTLQYGAEVLKAAQPPLAKLLVSCPVEEVRSGWSDFVYRLLRSTARFEESRLQQVGVVEEEQRVSVALDDGSSGSELRRVARYVPQATTSAVIERLCHPVTVDHASVLWPTWEAFAQLLSRLAQDGPAMRSLLITHRLHIVLLDTLTGRTSPLALPAAGHFRDRSYSSFYHKKTDRHADLTFAVRCLGTLMRSMGPPGYYLSGLGLPAATTIITGDEAVDRELCQASVKRALEAAYAKSRASAAGNPPLSEDDLARLTPQAVDTAAGMAPVFALERVPYDMFASRTLWLRLLRNTCDTEDLIRLACHMSYGANPPVMDAPINAILSFTERSANEDSMPDIADLVEALVRLPDKRSRERINILLCGQPADAALGQEATPGLVDIVVRDITRYPADTFELLWLVVRLCRVSKTAAVLLGSMPAFAELEYHLRRFDRGYAGVDAMRSLELCTGERQLRPGTAEYKRELRAISSTAKPGYNARAEACSLRVVGLGRDERASIMLAQLEAALEPHGLQLQGEDALFAAEDDAIEVAQAAAAAEASESGVGTVVPPGGGDYLGVD